MNQKSGRSWLARLSFLERIVKHLAEIVYKFLVSPGLTRANTIRIDNCPHSVMAALRTAFMVALDCVGQFRCRVAHGFGHLST